MSKHIFKQNAIYIKPTGEYIISTHPHDFKAYHHTDGRWIAVDGGKSYVRRVGDLTLYGDVCEEYSLDNSTDKFKEIRLKALWGTRGKDGKSPLQFKPIRTFTRAHLRSIKKNCGSYMNPVLFSVVKYWLKKKYNE